MTQKEIDFLAESIRYIAFLRLKNLVYYPVWDDLSEDGRDVWRKTVNFLDENSIEYWKVMVNTYGHLPP